MERTQSDYYIEMRLKFLFDSPIRHLGEGNLTRLLAYLEDSQCAKPIEVSFSGKTKDRRRKKKISHYLDPALLKILEPTNQLAGSIRLKVDTNPYCEFTFVQWERTQFIVIALAVELVELWGHDYIQKLFKDIVSVFPETYFADCCFTAYHSEFNRKYMDVSPIYRPKHAPFLVWLQYLSAADLQLQGGRPAFESNPLLQTTHLHDGLLVEVGESPYDVFTDEGEALLVKATFSLPLITH